jgi:oxalate decarboxylase/phosphoglucose isomerase-like protein (cupin superfamily)
VQKRSGKKINVLKAPIEKRLTKEAGWNRMDLRWLINNERVGSNKGVLGFTVFPPGASHEAHVHENAEEYIIITGGEGVQRVGNKKFRVKIGDVIFVPQNSVHSTRNSSKRSNLELYFVYAGAPSLASAGYKPIK